MTLPDFAKFVSPSNYPSLRKLAEEAGLFDRQPVFFSWKVAQTTVLYLIAVVILFLVDNLWIQLLNAVYFGFVFGQIGLLGHDAGHHQIFAKAKLDKAISMFCGALIGISATRWIDKHNEHHAHANVEDMDPDIDIPIMAFSEEQAAEKRGLFRFMVRHQHWFFFPVLTLTGLSLRRDTLRVLQQGIRKTWLDLVLLALHFVLYFVIIFSVMPFWHAVAFIILHQATFGLYMGLVFAPNHKGMLIINKDMKLDFVSQQVLTARNVRPNPVIDFWYGGLNYQIEHHLFPNMPRNRLGKARRIVKEFCAHRGIPYHETSVIQSYREILAHMRAVGRSLVAKKAA